MIHIKLDILTVYIAQPRGGLDIRSGILVWRTEAECPRGIGFHYTQTSHYHAVRGNFITILFWSWARTFQLGKAYDKDGKQIRKQKDALSL